MGGDISLLDQVRIASPCSASWAEMEGDERVRFCGQCKLHVYNLSEMARAEAEELIRTREGRLCARIYRRQDGTVLTRDCPIGWLRLRRAAGALTGCMAAVVGLLLGVLSLFGVKAGAALRYREPFARIYDWINPQPHIPAGWTGGVLIP